MNRTTIYTTKKLEKLVRKIITTDSNNDPGVLGDWNATVFYVDRKKCWLITNKLTKYNIILTDVKSSELSKIEQIFKDTFYAQLTYDGIITDFARLDSIIGAIDFQPTDNDRKTNGFQNHSLKTLEWWKFEYGSLENMPMKDLTNRLNRNPLKMAGRYGMSDYTYPINDMTELLNK